MAGDMKCDPGRCEGCRSNYPYVYPWGNQNARTAIVGERPAYDHASEGSECVFRLDVEQTPRTKQVLTAVFAVLGRQFDEFYFTNAYKCATRLAYEEERSCEELLERELTGMGVQNVIALGNNASKVLSGTKVEFEQVWNPASVLRRPEDFDEYVNQWRRVLEKEHMTFSDFA